MKNRIFLITFAAANLGLIFYGILALLRPDMLLEPFSAHIYQFPVEAVEAVTYISTIFRLLGWLNIIPGVLGLIILKRYWVTRREWYLRAVIALTFFTYLGPVVFDDTVGIIGFFEILEHILFLLVIVVGFVMLKHKEEVS